MANYEEEVNKQFGELGQKFEKLKAKQELTFSDNAVTEFCRGFYSPIIGSLAYLQQNAATHRSIQCVVSCDQISTKVISDGPSYESFADDLSGMTPPVGVDFTFKLTNSIYPIGEISEKLSVFFTNSGYEILYEYEGNQELRLGKAYMSHIEPNEIRQLRDLICISITKKVSQEIDKLL